MNHSHIIEIKQPEGEGGKEEGKASFHFHPYLPNWLNS